METYLRPFFDEALQGKSAWELLRAHERPHQTWLA